MFNLDLDNKLDGCRRKTCRATVTLPLNYPKEYLKSVRDKEQLSQIILKSIHNCRSYGLDKFGRMDTCAHAHTPTQAYTLNCHCDNYVSLTASGLDKKLKTLVQQIRICIYKFR